VSMLLVSIRLPFSDVYIYEDLVKRHRYMGILRGEDLFQSFYGSLLENGCFYS
jgi:hypothetical protein